jgi:carbon monoxide dehydrogenase subunit G
MEFLKTFAAELFDGIDFDDAIDKAVLAHDAEIEDLNIAQLKQGLKSDGTSTGEYKSIAYKGYLTPVDLEKTGAFHKGISAESKNAQLFIDSSDSKTNELQDKYGDEILGLTDENLDEVVEYIIDDVANNILEQIAA